MDIGYNTPEINGTTKMKHHMRCFIEEMLEYIHISGWVKASFFVLYR